MNGQEIKEKKLALEIANDVVGDWITETEYDGKMIEYCFFCSSDVGKEHKVDCTVLKAKKLIQMIKEGK